MSGRVTKEDALQKGMQWPAEKAADDSRSGK